MENRSRTNASKESKTASKFQGAKSSGSKNEYEVTEEPSVYEEVTAEANTKMVIDRQEDDWIELDGVGDGTDFFADDLDEDSIKQQGKGEKRSHSGVFKRTDGPKDGIHQLISNMPTSKNKKVKLNTDDSSIIGSLLDEVNMEQQSCGHVTEITTTNVSYSAKHLPLTLGKDGENMLEFYYLEAFQDPLDKPGTVYLFGKVSVESGKKYASCCVVVKEIPRRVFIAPRRKHLLTDVSVSVDDVYKEFDEDITAKYNIREFSKFSAGIPDREYLKMRYPATDSPLPDDLCGNTFRDVFGTRQSAVDILLNEKKIKYGRWLNIKNVETKGGSPPYSWCKFEVSCTEVDISLKKEISPSPPLVIMAFNLRVNPIPKTHDYQINMISWMIHTQYYEDKEPSTLFEKHYCAYTKPTTVGYYRYDKNSQLSWPILPTNRNTRKTTTPQKFIKPIWKNSERELLEFFLANCRLNDPDIIVNYDIYSLEMDVLVEKLVTNKVSDPSRIGRLRRKNFSTAEMTGSVMAHDVMVGRSLRNIKLIALYSFGLRSYDLFSLCKQVLNIDENTRKEIKPKDITKLFESVKRVGNLIKDTVRDTECILRIKYRLDAISLPYRVKNSAAGNYFMNVRNDIVERIDMIEQNFKGEAIRQNKAIQS